MDEQVMQRIDALAAKLGVVGEHLWEVLVRQAYITGATNLFHAAFVAVVVAAYFKWVVPWANAGGHYDERWIGAGLAGAALTVWTIIAFLLALDGVGYILNPEYFALRKVTP